MIVLCVYGFMCAGGCVRVLVFPESGTQLLTAEPADPIPFKMRGGRKAGVRHWPWIYAGAWAGAGTLVFDVSELFGPNLRS